MKGKKEEKEYKLASGADLRVNSNVWSNSDLQTP